MPTMDEDAGQPRELRLARRQPPGSAHARAGGARLADRARIGCVARWPPDSWPPGHCGASPMPLLPARALGHLVCRSAAAPRRRAEFRAAADTARATDDTDARGAATGAPDAGGEAPRGHAAAT